MEQQRWENLDRAYLKATADLANALAKNIDALSQRELQVLRQIPSYRRLPDSAVMPSLRRNVVRAVAMLRGEDKLPAEVEEDERESGRLRSTQGILAEDVVAAYRMVMATLRDAMIEESLKLNVPLDFVLRATRQFWDLTDSLSNELVASSNQFGVEFVRLEEQQRMTFLHRLLSGSLPPAEVARAGKPYGLVSDREYWVFRARADGPAAQQTLRALEAASSDPAYTPLLGPLDRDLAGILTRLPTIKIDNATIAISGPAPLPELSQAFIEATRLLGIAMRFQTQGIVTNSSLSIRIAVAQEDELGAVFFARYVAPVIAHNASPTQILETIRAYVACDCNVADCASILNIHQNTLRYRLARFESLTGANLRLTEELFEVWWALEYWVLHRVNPVTPARRRVARA